ncbi:MAG: GNAT family N-acetyltransferase, partial [Rhodospirillales bacterium]
MVNVRPATPEDADAIAELSRILARHVEDSDPGPDATEILSAGFGPDRWFNCLLAEDLFRVVGFALYCRRFDAHTRTRRLWLADLVVAPDRQRLGIGRVLVE